MKYILAYDIGTSGNKASLFNVEGEVVASEIFNYEVAWFNDGWAEQDADVWYESVCVLTKRLTTHINANDIVAVSFSGQMQGCLVVDREGNTLHKAIIWADLRAKEEEAFIVSKIDNNRFYKITGNRASCSYTLAKLLWLKNNKAEIYKQTYKVLNAKDYIILRLTGNFVTDYSDASATNLLDINKLEWSEEIADKVGVSLEKLPIIKQSTDVAGFVTEKAHHETGLCQGTSVVCGGGDGSISALGAMAVHEGDAFGTIGTSAWNAIVRSQPCFDKEMKTFTFAHVIPKHFIQLGTMQTAGASMNWWRTLLYQEKINEYDTIDKLVESSEVGAKGALFLPYLMGERSPRWDKNARACFIGLTMEMSEAEMSRAVYEGIAMNLEIILQLIANNTPIKKFVLTGGGAKSRVFSQILSDVYKLPISIPNYLEEATSFGAALCAGIGVGWFTRFDEIQKFISIKKTITPSYKNSVIYDKIKPIFNKAYFHLKDIFLDISKI